VQSLLELLILKTYHYHLVPYSPAFHARIVSHFVHTKNSKKLAKLLRHNKIIISPRRRTPSLLLAIHQVQQKSGKFLKKSKLTLSTFFGFRVISVVFRIDRVPSCPGDGWASIFRQFP